MRKPLWIAALLLLSVSLAAQQEARFMQFPDIHGETIVFTYEGDLWTVPAAGGLAQRLTTHPGDEYSARFSPDGTRIAFCGGYDGAPAVYLMPVEGGSPERLTYTPGFMAMPVAWTPDGQRVVFRANFEQAVQRDPALYAVATDGTAPERLPIDRGTLCSFSADGKRMAYNRRGREEYQWKRYRGGQFVDLWLYDFGSRGFRRLDDTVCKSAYPMWIGDKIYFATDRWGVANLAAIGTAGGEVTRLTRHEKFDVMWPETDGQRIVYVQDGYLHLYDVAAGTTRKLTVSLPSDRWRIRNRVLNPKSYIHSMDISNDGRTAVFAARGDAFTVSTGKGGQTRNLSADSGTREMHPRISPDGQWLAFFSDRSGEYQLYVQKTGGGPWTQLTTALNTLPYRPAWSPDGRRILFGDKTLSLFVVDVGSRALTKIDECPQLKNDEFTWEIDDYSWAPDSNWVAYTTVAYNRNSRVFLYSVADKRKVAVSDDFYNNLNPCFDAGGEYLYFLSSRNFDVVMDFYEDNHVIANPYQLMAVQLQAGRKPPFAEGEEPLAAPEKRKETEPPTVPLRIDADGLDGRIFPLPLPAGNYFFLRAGRGRVLWCSLAQFTEDEYEEIFKPRGQTKWDLHVFDMKGRKDVTLEQKIANFSLSVNGEKIIVAANQEFFAGSVDDLRQSRKPGDKVRLDGMVYALDTRKEWNQIFSDTWRWYRDFFYDAGMHGQDWQALGDAYRAMIPQLASREGLNWLMSQMVGELCVGHAYIGGGDMNAPERPDPVLFTGCLGADLAWDASAGRFRFARIFGPTPYNLDLKAPLVRPDMPLREGDFLLAINGTPLVERADYYRLLQVGRGQKVSLTVNSAPGPQGARTYEVEPLAGDRQLRYHRWLADNIGKVLKASNGRLGYMHITDMSSNAMAQFDKFWRAFRYKEGIIIDVRRNSGGWTEYFLIDKLERHQVGYNTLRGMEPFRYPGSVSDRRYVAISNEDNGSDGEAFIQHFKDRGLGPVVGVPSWGGLVGIINGQATVDNGGVQQPNNAFHGKSGQWWVENHGADPDVLVDNDPAAVMAGRDPQLEKAIEILMAQIGPARQDPFPPRPAYPKR